MSIQEPSQPFSSPQFVKYLQSANSSQVVSAETDIRSFPESANAEYSSFGKFQFNTTHTKDTASEGNILSSPGGMFIDLISEEQEWPIQNDLFDGKMVFLMKANPKSTYDFDGDENVHWELQMQGRFKRVPGPLYLSIEIPKEEKFGVSWFTKVVAKAFCKLIKVMGYNLLHHSFGEKGDLPHFATPAYQAFDKFIVRKSNQTSPELGKPIDESHESSVKRRKFESGHIIDTSSLYTMSFNDTFFDPVTWQVKGIPLFKPIDIKKFTNNIRFVIYEVEEEDHKPLSARDGNVRAVAHGTHTKRNIVMWFQLHRRGA
eukprot:CAMPEP_0195520772 /NCGR_PEP_ID=MMETSP0794_2-20130614/17536_1 /TAXON_ID=515487 /ORGANISM="Stephanopyxis turris, Strain CCMP 815" /LENGTH=315 /DNA_ID=CAMNT_0040650193 /DNA_START=243 /DNA_END=1190 /DNA_ORIENTATION=+